MFEAIVLGILQGLTEFIPVSSSAHLILFPWFFGWQGIVDTLAFDVALHFGTLIALLFYFRRDWTALLKTASKKDGMIWKFFIATIPAAGAGFLFHDWFGQLRSPALIILSLCTVSVLMIISENSYKKSQCLGMDKINLKDALIIGIAQAFALVPGVSRSGITIVAGLTRGLKREASARFSFLLSTPVVAGASTLEAKKLISSDNIELNIFIIGIIASAVTGYIAVRFLLYFFQRHSLRPFAYYRFFLAFVIIIIMWTKT